MAKMKTSAHVDLLIGAVACLLTMGYADGLSFVLFASILFLPLAALVAVLRSRVKRKKLGESKLVWSLLLLGVWLVASSGYAATQVTRPGREGSGMFGVLLLVWPAIVSGVGFLLVLPFLGGSQTTYDK